MRRVECRFAAEHSEECAQVVRLGPLQLNLDRGASGAAHRTQCGQEPCGEPVEHLNTSSLGPFGNDANPELGALLVVADIQVQQPRVADESTEGQKSQRWRGSVRCGESTGTSQAKVKALPRMQSEQVITGQ